MATAAMRRDNPEVLVTGRAARLAIRRDAHAGPTSGLAPGFVQANLAILPHALAEDFLQFCRRNPKPCPLIGVSAPGDPHIRGAYSYLAVGQYTGFNGIQGVRQGNLHFAGEQTSLDFQGYIEGALRSGYRCAAEVGA